MEVDTNKPGYTMFRGPQTKSTEYLKSHSHKYLQVFSYLCFRANANFITADIPGGDFVILEATKGETLRAQTASIAQEHSFEKRLERLEEQFNNLVRSTWGYLFTEKDIKEMGKLSKDMLEDSKKMRELAQQLQEADDET